MTETFTKKEFRSLFAFHADVNRILLDRASKISDAEFVADGIDGRSIRRILFHIMHNDYAWRITADTGKQPVSLEPEDFPTLVLLADAFAQQEAAFREYFDRVTEQELTSTKHVTADDEGEADLAVWKILLHIILHARQHHAELAYLLTKYGQSPGDLNYIDFEDPPYVG